MNRFLLVSSFVVAGLISIFLFPLGASAAFLCAVCTAMVLVAINVSGEEDTAFIYNIFFVALLLRIALATLIYVFDLQDIFGPDAKTYDLAGVRISLFWFGEIAADSYGLDRARSLSNPGWGMNYLVAFIYSFIGRNELAIQYFNCAWGAATAAGVYICSRKIFRNMRAARAAAIIAAVFPSMLIWSSQMLKDGLIIFLLVVSMIAVVSLHEKLNYIALAVLIFSLFGILSLRFYIFYMVVAAIVGSFVVGSGGSGQSLIRRIIILLVIGIALTYLGASKTADDNLTQYGNLENLQRSRSNQAESASGYAADADVSTVQGAIWVLPIGFIFLMFAPFPWDVGSLSKAIIAPETLVWYASIPFLARGLMYAIKNRLRSSVGILIFTLMLTMAYSIFQGNVGTAYRQRTQIQIFLFIFIGVGWALKKEEAEIDKLNNQTRGPRKLR